MIDSEVAHKAVKYGGHRTWRRLPKIVVKQGPFQEKGQNVHRLYEY